ncbi:hypothetical protein H6G17_26315 [Chroococcidiopsis sp. FACHB-1243]|nr:hypothetical protein [Chroococcidiopsis sp. [FACHB-1243]]
MRHSQPQQGNSKALPKVAAILTATICFNYLPKEQFLLEDASVILQIQTQYNIILLLLKVPLAIPLVVTAITFAARFYAFRSCKGYGSRFDRAIAPLSVLRYAYRLDFLTTGISLECSQYH